MPLALPTFSKVGLLYLKADVVS